MAVNRQILRIWKSIHWHKTQSGLSLTTSIKDQIRDDILKKYNVGSITPEFVDLDTILSNSIQQ